MTARAGFDGYYKSNFWVPIQISVRNEGNDIEGELRVVTGATVSDDAVVYETPITLPTRSDKQVILPVHLSRYVTQLQVELVNQRGQVIYQVETNGLIERSAEDLLYGVVSPEPGELDFLENVAGTYNSASVAFLDIGELPAIPVVWQSLDVLVFNDVDTAQLNTAQQAALATWVSSGGHLVVTGGPGWQKTAASLSEMLPVAIGGTESLAALPALAELNEEPFRDAGPYIVTTSSLTRGDLMVHQDGLPLLAQRVWGKGVVYFLALDPKLAPLLDWDGSEALFELIANKVPLPAPWEFGIQDFSAAGTAVEMLPSLTLPSTLQLVLLLLTYVVVIGPVNYWVLKRRNQPELAWLTIPSIVIFFTILGYVTGFQLKGNKIIVNEMAVAYGQVGAEAMRVDSLIGLYSPRRSAYDLVLPLESTIRPFSRGFTNQGGNIDAISRSNEVVVQNVRVDVSSTETFIAQSYQPVPDITGEVVIVEDDGLQLSVTVQNNGDQTLEQVSIVIGRAIYELGDTLPAGGRLTLAKRIGASTLTTVDTEAAIIVDNIGTLVGDAAYDQYYYYGRNNDPKAARAQLLRGLSEDSFSSSTGRRRSNTNDVTLIAWGKEQQLNITLDRPLYEVQSTVLYFLDLPLTMTLNENG